MMCKGRILVVDDTLASLKVLVDILTAEGYAVRAADGGELALRAATAEPPELILLDIRMPEMDGFEVCQRLKAQPETREIPVIFLSAANETDKKVQGLGLGAVDFIAKPFQREELLARVHTHLELFRLRNRLEERVKERTREFKESEERFRVLVEHAPEAIFVYDVDLHRLVDANEKALRLSGRTREQMLDTPLEALYAPRPSDDRAPADSERDHHEAALAGNVVVYERRVRALDGRETPCEVWLVRLPAANRRLLRASFIDITERKRAEAEVQELLAETERARQSLAIANQTMEDRVRERTTELSQERDLLRQANEKLAKAIEDLRSLDKLKGAFVSAVSHDLRVPLTGIVGYAEFLEDGIGGELTETQQAFVSRIIEASQRMTRLLNEFLDYARMEAGKFKVEPRPIGFSELAQQAIESFRPNIETKRLGLEENFAPALPEVMADPDRLVQIMSNLLANAIKFTPTGGSITVRAYPQGEKIVTEVSDTGIGIPLEDLPHIFERFFQTEAGRQAGGTGLGLSIIKSLVEAQEGTLTVESIEGKGSTFRFTLPIARPL